jgi:hypothetical protein
LFFFFLFQMSSLLVTLFVVIGFMATWQLASWDAHSDVALESSPDGGQIIIDRLSPSFRVLPIQEMDGSWSDPIVFYHTDYSAVLSSGPNCQGL